MSRVLRKTRVGVRVSKGPAIKEGVVSSWILTPEDIEPRVIDRKSHKKFVRNMFAIRSRSANFA